METMIFKVGDEVSFNGQYEKTKEVYFSGLRKKVDPQFFNETHETRILVAQPHSKFRVKETNYPYYLCEKMWEHGDEEIPVNAQLVPIHINEVIPYCKEWEGTVTNKTKDL
jgi:predicted transposase YdaD